MLLKCLSLTPTVCYVLSLDPLVLFRHYFSLLHILSSFNNKSVIRFCDKVSQRTQISSGLHVFSSKWFSQDGDTEADADAGKATLMRTQQQIQK